jgi:YYY domain-containing protein
MMPYAFKPPCIADLFTPKAGSIGPIPFVYPDIMNQHWLTDIQNQEELLSGGAFPPNVQWIGRSRWLWPLQQMVSWGMGPAFGITAWLGVGFAAIYAWRQKQPAWLVPIAWVLGYFGFMGMQFSLYMRYFLPLYPALAVFASYLLYHTWLWASSDRPMAALGWTSDRFSALKPVAPLLARAGVVVVVVFTVLAGLAFYDIYRSPVTRATASCWMYANIPEGSVIGHEHWDDVVPYNQPGCQSVVYDNVEFQNFGADTPEKVEQLMQNINSVDYFAPASARLWGTIPRVPAVYPVTARFYDLLESDPESIGFRRIAEFTSHPSIFGRSFDDTGAEESFSVYDHPEVVVYEKTADYDAATTRRVLGADAFINACTVQPRDAGQNCLMFKPEVLAAQKAGGTWSDTFDAGSLINRFPAVFFVLVMQIAGFAVLPLAMIAFRGLPDRGYLLSKPLGIIGLAYLVYAPAGFGLFDYTRGSIAGILAIMVLAGGVAAIRWRAELLAWFRDHWRFAVACEAIFLLAFLFSYWIRLQNPDLYHPFTGGEKPMDFAYFNGVLRTTDLTQGPVDPWYAGGYLNYYWWGFFIGATPIKLLGIVPEVAYNLVVPMFFALSAAATFSVAYNLSESTRQLMRRRPGRLPISPAGPLVAGVLAIFFVMIAGNLKAIGVLEDNFARVSPWNPDIPVVGSVVVIFGGFYEAAFGDASFRQLVYDYDWWAPSRALTIIPGQENTVTPITEFPFWTYLFADLHAHLMAIPFSMTVTGVALGAVLNFTRLNPAGDAGRRASREWSSWAMVVVLGVIVGALRWINSWDYPPFLLIGTAGLILGERAKEGRWTLRALTLGVAKAAVMGILSYAFYTVVAKNYSQSYSSVQQADQTTDLTDFISHFGVFLFIITGFLLFQLNRAITRSPDIRWIFFGGRRRTSAIRTLPVMLALILAGWLTIALFTVPRWGVTGVALVGLITLIILAAYEIRRPTPTAPLMLFAYAMTALGFGLVGGVEMITLEGDVGRMNTVFKFYLHVWMMWGVISAFALWYIFGVARPHEAFLRRGSEANRVAVLAPRYAFAFVVIVLALGTLVYPYFGTRARVYERFDPSLGTGNDGLAWMESTNITQGGAGPEGGNIYRVEYEATGMVGEHQMRYTRDAINWVRENIDGTPTIIEAIGPSYRSLGSRFAINTGLPTVHGWGFHQSQQRVKFAQTLQQRQADVNEFYTTSDIGRARLIIDKYDVEWVIVGDEELFNYGEAGLEKFEDGLLGTMELMYENPSNQIWRVIPEEARGTEIIVR